MVYFILKGSSYAPTLMKVDPGSTSLGSSKLLIKSVYMKYDMIIKELSSEVDLLFCLLTILQIFSPEVTLIRDHVLINVGTYEPKVVFFSPCAILHGNWASCFNTCSVPIIYFHINWNTKVP